MGKYLVCISGASGSIYGIRTIQALTAGGHEVHLIVSAWGKRVLEQETNMAFAAWMAKLDFSRSNVHHPDDLGAPPASGSFRFDAAIVAPCSMNSIGAIASGVSGNLIHRAGQVALKEGWPLLLVPRETPLSLINLRNLTALAEAGAIILPASPAFYHAPQNMDDMINFVVGKILDRLSVAHDFNTIWKGLPQI